MREVPELYPSPIKITATDEPGAGGANHRYEVTGFETGTNPATLSTGPEPKSKLVILFQNGTVPTAGVNGLTESALLEIVADRLRSFQSGPFRCRENALALTKVEEALHWLQHRSSTS